MSDDTSYMTIAVSYGPQCIQPTVASLLQLEAIEVVCDTCKFRLTFKNSRSVDDVLSDGLRGEVMQKVADFNEVDGLLSIPDYYFSCDGLSLRRLSVYGAELKDGRNIVTLRWSRVTGSIHSALKVCPEYLLSPQPDNARLAFQVLDCVLQPIFNLTKIDPIPVDGHKRTDEIKKLINGLVAKQDELEKYAKMLKIYLEHDALADSSVDKDDAKSLALRLNKQHYIC